jgi:hypothetical protein
MIGLVVESENRREGLSEFAALRSRKTAMAGLRDALASPSWP